MNFVLGMPHPMDPILGMHPVVFGIVIFVAVVIVAVFIGNSV